MLAKLDLDDNAPWKQRFRAPVVLWTQIAPANRARGLAVTNRSGRYQLYGWDVPSGTLRQLTDRPAGILDAVLAGDGRHIYYLDDKQGNEIGHLVRVPFEGGEAEDVTPELPSYSSFSFSSSGSGRHFGLTAATRDGFDAMAIETSENGTIGTPRLLFHSAKLAFGPWFSFQGELAVVGTTERSAQLHYNLLAFDMTDGRQIAELWDGEGLSLEPLGFSPVPGDLRLAGTSNRSGDKRPFVWDPRTGERTDLDFPELTGEIVPFGWSSDARALLLCQFHQAVQQLYVYELANGKLTKLHHPSGTYGFFAGLGTYFGPSDEIFAQWQDAAHPSQLIALNPNTGAKNRDVLVAGNVPPGHPWKSISFPSSDGQVIQAWLGLPDGEGPFPTIVHTHGGPESVMTEMYGPGSQAWMDHGFAFLSVNYRGSTTFGREFQERIWGDLGHWEMEDLAAAHRWVVEQGIAQPDAILLTGGSYGGYNTLMGLGKLPDLWAGGMGLVVIADWAMMYEDSADTLRGYQVGLFGGTPE